jgi:pSer/pThr/pTyr-binding forkhead associated (FHA) protein
MPKLIVSPSKSEKQEINLEKARRLLIGRAPDNDIVISCRRASRKHARIEKRGKEFIIVDEGSFNGTFLNQQRISKKTLRNRDVIQIANWKLVFSAPGENVYSPDEVETEEGPDTDELPDLPVDFSFDLTPEDIEGFQKK